MPVLLSVLGGLLFGCLVYAVWCMVKIAIDRFRNRAVFRETYGFDLPSSFRVRTSRGDFDLGLTLAYPRWANPKSDGTADKRFKRNWVIAGESRLDDGDIVVSHSDPVVMYELVVLLREAGYAVPPCREEVGILELSGYVVGDASTATASVYERLAGDHRAFEFWCAEVLRGEGWAAEVTQASSDGGMDIFVRRGSEYGIVECKLYKPSNRVSIKEVQKLVGAGGVGSTAVCIFMTTSTFGKAAREYAHEHGVRLIDGTELELVSTPVPARELPDRVLTDEIIRSNYPADMRLAR